MPDHAAETATASPARLCFDRYVIDLGRQCLLRGGSEIPLRPKTFAVLRYLGARPQRLVTKEELFAAVWPNLAVTDDVLVQSIGELRRALGEEGAAVIRTVPRRGYRFEATVSAEAADPSPPTTVPTGPVPPVARPRWPWLPGSPYTGAVILGVVLVVALAAAWIAAGRGGVGSIDPRNLSTAGASARPAVAVLPLSDQSDPARAYFADGLTQDIINALGRFSGLTVMSWNAVLPYRGTPASPAELGRGLGVSYVVEGSLREVEDGMRLSAQLVDTSGRVLWSARFDKALPDVFALQEQIATEVVRALAVRVTEIEQRRVLAKPPGSLAAYDLVLRARPALQRPTRAGLVDARALLNKAIALDANYAAAYTGLAESYYDSVSMGWAESPSETLDRAEQLALEALSLDTSEVRARVILARIHILHQSYREAEAEIERAIATNPNDAQALGGRGNILVWLGQSNAAITALEQAERIDPNLHPFDRFSLGLAYYLERRFAEAVEQAELILRDTNGAGGTFALPLLAAAYAQLERGTDARRVADTIRQLDPTFQATDFGSKFLSPEDLADLRDGLRRAGLYADGPTGG